MYVHVSMILITDRQMLVCNMTSVLHSPRLHIHNNVYTVKQTIEDHGFYNSYNF